MNKPGWLRFFRNYRFQSLFFKNLLIVFALTLLPFAGITFAVYQQMNGIVKNEISDLSQNSLYRIRDMVDTVVKQTDLLATKLSLQSEVELFVFSANPEQTLSVYYRDIYKSISMVTSVYRYIDSIYIYSERNDYIVANGSGMPMDDFKDNNWYSEYASKTDNSPWTMARKKEGSYPYYISLVRPMYLYLPDRVGAVIVNIHMEELAKLIGAQRSATDEQIYIVDRTGVVLLSGERRQFQSSYRDVDVLAPLSLTESSKAAIVGGQEYMISITASKVFDWTYVSVLPMHHYQEKMLGMRTFMLTFSLIGLAVIVLVSYLISVRTFAPVKKIMSVLDHPHQPNHDNSPELKFIVSHIQKHITTSQELELELERRMELLNKARSLALQSQINPHFLYNTLDAIKWTAIRLTGRDNDASVMISSLSELMRLSAAADSHLIPVAKEIEHGRKYVDIIRYRYDDLVSVHWEFPEELLDCQIVQLSLQPLIENAIYHGIKPTRRKGNVWVRGKRIGASLIIEVQDDGNGLPPHRLKQLNRMLEEESDLTGKHIGLPNVSQRIKLIFGSHYGMTIRSEEGGGTTVTLWLPAIDGPP